jgi:hypothetical protein
MHPDFQGSRVRRFGEQSPAWTAASPAEAKNFSLTGHRKCFMKAVSKVEDTCTCSFASFAPIILATIIFGA